MEIIRRQRVVKGEYEMLLKNLHILNFKMFEDLNLQFKPGFNLKARASGVRPHKEKINISKEIINKTR